MVPIYVKLIFKEDGPKIDILDLLGEPRSIDALLQNDIVVSPSEFTDGAKELLTDNEIIYLEDIPLKGILKFLIDMAHKMPINSI